MVIWKWRKCSPLLSPRFLWWSGLGSLWSALGMGSHTQPPVTPSYGLNTLLTVPSEGCPGEPCFCGSLITPIFNNFPLGLIFFISRSPCSLWQRPPFRENSRSSLKALRRAATFSLLLLLLWRWDHTFWAWHPIWAEIGRHSSEFFIGLEENKKKKAQHFEAKC